MPTDKFPFNSISWHSAALAGRLAHHQAIALISSIRKRTQVHSILHLFRPQTVFRKATRSTAGTAQSRLAIIKMENNLRAAHQLMGMPRGCQIFRGKVMSAHFQ